MKRFSELGFTLLETLVAMAIAVAVGTVLLSSFTLHLRVTRQQVEKAELRQSLRIARLELGRSLRRAGRGGLPSRRAVASVQNVGSAERIGRHWIAEGSDVLILRGAFDFPVWRVAFHRPLEDNGGVRDHAVRDDAVRDDAVRDDAVRDDAVRVYLAIDENTGSGAPQSLEALEALLEGGTGPESLLWLCGAEGYDLARIESGTIEILEEERGGPPVERRRVVLEVRLASLDAGLAEIHAGLAPDSGFTSLWTIRTAALVREIRFFVREPSREKGVHRWPRVLSMARMVPGTDLVLSRGSGAGYDISDDVRDLQVAFGVSVDHAFGETDGQPAPLQWVHSDSLQTDSTGPIRALRVTLLGEASSPDLSHRAMAIERIEDHVYGEITDRTKASRLRRYRRLLSRLQVRLRSS